MRDAPGGFRGKGAGQVNDVVSTVKSCNVGEESYIRVKAVQGMVWVSMAG